MKKSLLILAVLVLAACNKQEESHTRSWYREHDAERKAMVAQCKDDAAKAVTPECMNATNAESDIYINGKDYYKQGGGSDSNNAPNLTNK
jgi:Tfp pilus assembly protein PilP